MNDFSQVTFAVMGYRIITVLVGFAFAWLGYKLFCKGIYEKSGNFRADVGKYSFVLKQAAPGVFFALFGAMVIGVSLWQGIGIRRSQPEVQYSQPWMSYRVPKLPTDVESIVEKVVNGQTLSEGERGRLQQWYEEKRGPAETWEFEVYKHPSSKEGEHPL